MMRRLGEIEHEPCIDENDRPDFLGEYENYLPPATSNAEIILDSLLSTAKTIWPDDMARAEAWAKEQAVRYATAEVKSQAASIAANPLTLLVIGGVLFWMLTKK